MGKKSSKRHTSDKATEKRRADLEWWEREPWRSQIGAGQLTAQDVETLRAWWKSEVYSADSKRAKKLAKVFAEPATEENLERARREALEESRRNIIHALVQRHLDYPDTLRGRQQRKHGSEGGSATAEKRRKALDTRDKFWQSHCTLLRLQVPGISEAEILKRIMTVTEQKRPDWYRTNPKDLEDATRGRPITTHTVRKVLRKAGLMK